MSRRVRWGLVVLALLTGFACGGGCVAKRSPPDAGPDAPPKFVLPGKCFGKPSKCRLDIDCGPPFNTCQEGTCCSGTLDPQTCACNCGEGGACAGHELCCPDDKNVFKCRPLRECYGPLEK